MNSAYYFIARWTTGPYITILVCVGRKARRSLDGSDRCTGALQLWIVVSDII